MAVITPAEPKICDNYNHRWDSDPDKKKATQFRVQFDRNLQHYITYYCSPHAGGQKRKDKAPWRGATLAWWHSVKTTTEEAAIAEDRPLFEVAIKAAQEAEAKRVSEAKAAAEQREREREEAQRLYNERLWEASTTWRFSTREEGIPESGIRVWRVIDDRGDPTEAWARVDFSDKSAPAVVSISNNLYLYRDGHRYNCPDMAFMLGTCVQEAAAYAEYLNEKNRPAK